MNFMKRSLRNALVGTFALAVLADVAGLAYVGNNQNVIAQNDAPIESKVRGIEFVYDPKTNADFVHNPENKVGFVAERGNEYFVYNPRNNISFTYDPKRGVQ